MNQIPENLKKAFILAGNSKVIFHNPLTQVSLTYKIRQAKDLKDLFFVSAYNINDSEYQYIGIISNDQFRTTAKSKLTSDSTEVKAFIYVFNKIKTGTESVIQVRHAGQCGKCGKELTDPISIDLGFGPICFKKITGMTFSQYLLQKTVSRKFDEWVAA